MRIMGVLVIVTFLVIVLTLMINSTKPKLVPNYNDLQARVSVLEVEAITLRTEQNRIKRIIGLGPKGRKEGLQGKIK